VRERDPAIRIVEPDPAWAARAREELRRIEAALGPLAVRLEHVGSTAVPGLAAKPILDLQLSVPAIEPLEAYADPLASLGYVFVPDPDMPDYHFFGKPAERPRTHHLHVCEAGSAHERRHLAVRDFLRAHPDEAASYADLKRAVAARHPQDRLGYITGKEQYLRDVETRALRWIAAPWTLDERAHAGRENLDPVHVARYDRKEDANAAAELAGLRARGLDESAIVVDLGAGTGQFTLAAAAAVRRVVAVDVSAPMLEHLRATLRDRRIENVECVPAGFLTYEHRGEPPDLVYSRYALHHLPDFWKALALARIAEMLRPGGILRLVDVVYGFDPADAGTVLERWMETAAADDPEDDWTRAELEEHVRDENSTFTWLLEPMLEKAGLTIEHAEYSEDRMFASYICVRGDAQRRSTAAG
jgi:GrpB-like predicted nucleotidyltransferase (UPF0157 family)/SAM-dependent methyltransferase